MTSNIRLSFDELSATQPSTQPGHTSPQTFSNVLNHSSRFPVRFRTFYSVLQLAKSARALTTYAKSAIVRCQSSQYRTHSSYWWNASSRYLIGETVCHNLSAVIITPAKTPPSNVDLTWRNKLRHDQPHRLCYQFSDRRCGGIERPCIHFPNAGIMRSPEVSYRLLRED